MKERTVVVGTWPIHDMHFYPDSRTCYVLFCPSCGKTYQTRDPKPIDFHCYNCMVQMEVDLNGISETSTLEVYKKAVNYSCIRSMASGKNRL